MTANAGEIRARLVLSNDEYKRKMNETREEMKRTSFSADQMKKDFTSIQKASAAVGTAVLAGIGGSVKVAADFEQSMAQVQAISGSTAEEFARQERAAREMGATTIFSASESAEALGFLAMAGYDVEQQVATLPSVLNAAIAGNMELAQSADIVTNIMTGFGLAAEDAEMAVDVLAKTSNTANTDIPQLGEAFKYVAPVANSLGWTIEETAAAIGRMSDAGIQGGQAGTSLRAALLALANPTGQTKDAIEELNIELLDSEGNMKPLPELMGHIAERMDGMTDSQKTQTAAQLVGSQAASGFIALLSEGEEGLQDYVTELENSAGTAQEMADIQANTLNGAFKEFQSVLEEVGIKLGQEFIPHFRDIVSYGTDVVKAIGEVDASTMKAGLAFAGTAAAIALTVSTVGKLVIATRGLMASMGPAGWLIVGLSVLGGVIAGVNTKMNENRKVNTENAEAMHETANTLEETTKRFDELQFKSRLSNKEFGRMIDIQKELEQTQNPAKVADLQEEYEKLAKKSGLSNDELQEMFGLNNDLIEQSPTVEQSFTDKGAAIVETTDAVHDQIQALRELTLEELRDERRKALINEKELREELVKDQKELKRLTEEINTLEEYRDIPLSQARDRMEEIEQKLNDVTLETGERNRLEEEYDYLLLNEQGLIDDTILKLIDKKEKISENISETEEELAKLDEVNALIADILLAEVDLNFEKGEGLVKLDERIDKLKDERQELINNATEEEIISGLYDERLRDLDDAIGKHESIRDRIFEETEYQSEQNAKLDDQNTALDTGLGLIQDSIGAFNNRNQKIDEGTDKARIQNQELGLDINKKITVDDDGTAQDVHNRATAPGTKHVTIWESVRRFSENRHQGGIIGTQSRGNLLPNLHVGGIADDAANNIVRNMQNTPLHNEIDVRLLRNEMVLTEGQQANLWRLVENNSGTRSRDDSEYWLQAIQLLSEIARSTEEGKYTELLLSERYFGSRLEPIITEIQQRKNNPRRAGRVDR